MTKVAQLTMVIGVLIAPAVPALAQADEQAKHDGWQYGRPDNVLPIGQYEALRVGPLERRQGGVTFITGGSAKDEAAAFRAAMSRHALGIEFARAGAPRGALPADVHVSLIDHRGRIVLQTVSDGPFLLADLLTGTYTIRAACNGQVKTQTVTILPDQHRHVTFVW